MGLFMRRPHGPQSVGLKSPPSDARIPGFVPSRLPLVQTSRLVKEIHPTMPRTHFCFCVLCAVLGLFLIGLLLLMPGSAQAQAPKGPLSFINDVAPILKENCFACHF